MRTSRWGKAISMRLSMLFLFVLVVSLSLPAASALAASPTIVLGIVGTNGCVTGVTRPFDLDTFTRDSLPQEMSPSWPVHALRANAILIRTFARYFQLHPESGDPAVCNPNGLVFHMRTTRIQGWSQGRGATQGNVNNMTNDRVTDTGGRVLLQDNQIFMSSFNACLQNEIKRLADLGYTYVQILTHATVGIYSVARCGLPQRTNLTIGSAYPFTLSMMNGTVPFALTGGTPTSTVTPINTAREAERYWGHSHMDSVLSGPFSQPGTYVVGLNMGDKVEYRMQFGGVNENLHLIGISDKPGPVVMNIYIDGYYKRKIQWAENDNKRHLRVDKIPGISFGDHAIAIEFSNDQPGASTDLDRNFYIDVIGVNSGPINP